MITRFHIGIDIDNTISDSSPLFLNKFNETFKTKVTYEETGSFWFTRDNTGVEDRLIGAFFDELLLDEEFQLKIPPYGHALEVISKWLQKKYPLHYITARPIGAKRATRQWLVKHGFMDAGSTLDLFDPLEFQSDTEYKKKAAQRLKVDIFIEDSLEIANALMIPVLLLSRPWNHGKIRENVRRVSNWSEIDNIIQNIEF